MENKEFVELQKLEKLITGSEHWLKRLQKLIEESKGMIEGYGNVDSEFIDMKNNVLEVFNFETQINYFQCLLGQKDKIQQFKEEKAGLEKIELGMVVVFKHESGSIQTIYCDHQLEDNRLDFKIEKFKIIEPDRPRVAGTIEQDYHNHGFTIVDKEGDYFVLIKNDKDKEYPFYVNEANLKKHFALKSKPRNTVYKTEFIIDEFDDKTIESFTQLIVKINGEEIDFAGFTNNPVIGQTMVCYHFKKIKEPIDLVQITSDNRDKYHNFYFAKTKSNILKLKRGGMKYFVEGTKGTMQLLTKEEVKSWVV